MPSQKIRISPLIEQVYFHLLNFGSPRCIHVTFIQEVLHFLKVYKTKSAVTVINNKGKRVNINLPPKENV